MSQTTAPLLSFHGKQEIKDTYVNRVKLHQLADEIEQGFYWDNGKGCAVGCTIHGNSHKKYETELGIPFILARLEDCIFENLSNIEAKAFPLAFLEAIRVGTDLRPVFKRFLIWVLVDENEGVIRHAQDNAAKKVIQDVADLLEKSITEEITYDQFMTVREPAVAARRRAATAAAATAAAAAAAAAAYAAAYADAYAYAYAYADAYADAYAAAYADADAYAAAYAYADAYADADADAATAAYAAAAKRWIKMRDVLLMLLRQA